MPKDYKNRIHHKKKSKRTKNKKIRLSGLDGLLIISFLVITVLFGVSFLSQNFSDPITNLDSLLSTKNVSEPKNAEIIAKEQLQKKSIQALAAKAQAKIKQKTDQPTKQDKVPPEPRFDFYTILPKLEVVIPEHEIKTRIREQRIGTLKKNGKYIIQAGSFRDFLEAKKLQDKLMALGVESRIEQAQVGNVVWNRVKMGPFSGLDSLMAIKTRLRNNGINTLVLEFKS
jgi:cell division protein FtsN